MVVQVLFVQGAGEGAYDESAPLVASLRSALGGGFEVHAPRMPDEGEPDGPAWRRRIGAELARLRRPVVLVGHSLGGSVLLRHLAENPPAPGEVAGLYLLAAPAWDGVDWSFEELRLPEDTAQRLSNVPRIVVCHGGEDAVVPYTHLALHAERLPRARLRVVDGVGHSFGNDLSAIARDIAQEK